MAKDNKTSKTARVMNLLSKKPDPAAPQEEAAPASGSAPAAPPAPAPAVPPIVASMAPDAAVSVQIRNALEDALESELGPAPAAPQPEPVPEPEPQPVQQPAPQPEPDPEPVQPEPQPEPEPVQAASAPVEKAEPAPEEEPHFKEPLIPDNPGYINVMQVLVEEKAPKYIQMFGLCPCERCLADVKAFTLNHLPSKYVVIERGDLIPRLTVYEGKFTSDVTAQLLQACKVINERPHHGR